MTAPAPPVSRLRCPREGCGHFPNRTDSPPPELLEGLGEWKHSVYAIDDRGHAWTTSWLTEKETQ